MEIILALQKEVSYFCKLVLLFVLSLIHEPNYRDPAYNLFSASHVSVRDLSFPLLLFGLDTSLQPQTAQTGFISSLSTMTHMLLVFTCRHGVHIILIICCYYLIRLLCLWTIRIGVVVGSTHRDMKCTSVHAGDISAATLVFINVFSLSSCWTFQCSTVDSTALWKKRCVCRDNLCWPAGSRVGVLTCRH